MMPSTTVFRIVWRSDGAVAKGLLRRGLLGDVAEDEDGTDHLAVAVANRCAAVGDGALAPVARDQHRVLRQALVRSLRQGFLQRNRGRLAGLLIDDAKDLVRRTGGGLRLRPAGEPLGERVQDRHAPVRHRWRSRRRRWTGG